ncbi:hypothetical protein [Actinoplanes sp. CA-252034]|uniref:hypothetical protein n=1 Tax=Actinoplanes sp. CA-252034 TaxID=3239906 RepID=UPI003D9668A8
MTRIVRAAPALAGAALLLIVLATTVEGHYLQIEWQATAVPLAWWYAADVAGTVAVPAFLGAVGLGLGGLADRPLADVLRTRVAPNLTWYAVSVSATLIVLWRLGPVYGLPPVRDLPELLRLLLLPPTGLALTYALALFPLLAWTARGLPRPLLVAAAVTLAVVAGVAAARNPTWATAAGLTRNLLFFLVGWHLAVPAHPVAGALAAVGRAAAPIAALALPATAAVGGALVRRLSALDGPLQILAAVAEPVLVVALVVVAGLAGHRWRARVPRPVTR